MPTYTIIIKNKSSQSQSLLLFQDLPKPANIPSDQVFTNVYQQASRIPGNGEARFEVSSDLYALHGSSHRTDDGRVKVEVSDSRRASLGPNGSKFYLTTENSDGQSPRFDREDDSVGAPGAFSIGSDDTFSYQNPGSMYFGVGAMETNRGEVVPVQTYQARPNVVAQIYARPQYYVAFGSFEPGTIINPIELGRVLSIDFTGCDGRSATFILDDRNDYIADPDMDRSGIRWSVAPKF